MTDPARDTRMRFEDAETLDPDRDAGELEAGRFVSVTRNPWRHGEIVGNVYALLRAFAREQGGWSISVGEPGTKLRRDPDTLRGPDVGVIRSDRRPEGKGAEGWLEGAPELAVEVSGDAQGWPDQLKKALEYLSAGGKMVWLVDAQSERVVVCTPPNTFAVLGSDDELEGGDVLPGFRCRVKQLFE